MADSTIIFPSGMNKLTNIQGTTKIMAADANGQPVYVEMSDVQAEAAANVIGTITSVTQAPTDSETTGQAYDLGDDVISAAATDDVALGGTFGTIPKGTSGGWLRKQSDGSWELVPIKVDLTGYTLKTDFDPVKIITNYLNSLFSSTIDGIEFSVRDGNGNDIMQILTAGILSIKQILTDIVTATKVNSSEVALGNASMEHNPVYEFVIQDANNKVLFAVDKDGNLINLGKKNIHRKILGFNKTWVLCTDYGQSLSVGGQSPLTTKKKFFGAYMFNTGIATASAYAGWSAAASTASLLVPINSTSGSLPGYSAEFSLLADADFISKLIMNAGGINLLDDVLKLLYNTGGVGSQPIANLIKGTQYYSDLIDYYNRAKTLTDSDLEVRRIDWKQGEADYTSAVQADYKATLLQLISDLNADILSITGQTINPIWLMYQNSGWSDASGSDLVYPAVPLALADVGINSPNCYLVTPIYPFHFWDGSDNTDTGIGKSPHLTVAGYKSYGAHCAYVWRRVIMDGVDWKPTYPISFNNAGTTIEIIFNVPHGYIVFDESVVVNPGNYGFNAYDASGNQITITNVAITGFNKVTITLATAMPTGGKITYALNPNTTGNGYMTGARGNLRDTMGDVEVYVDADSDFTYKLHNYCVAFSKTF